MTMKEGMILGEVYGDEDQNELMAEIKSYKEADKMEFAEKVKKLEEEISLYKEAIRDGRGALEEAERELDELIISNADLPY